MLRADVPFSIGTSLGPSASVGLGIVATLRPSSDGSEFDRASAISDRAIWDFPLPPSTSHEALSRQPEFDEEEEDVLSTIASTPSRSSAASTRSTPLPCVVGNESAGPGANIRPSIRESSSGRPTDLGHGESKNEALRHDRHLARRHSLIPHPHVNRRPAKPIPSEGSPAAEQEARHRKLTSLMTTLSLARARPSASQRASHTGNDSVQRTPVYTLRKRSAPEVELVLGAHSASQLAPKLASHLGVPTSSPPGGPLKSPPMGTPPLPEELTAGAKAAQVLGLDAARSQASSGTASIASSEADHGDILPTFPAKQDAVLEKAM